LWMGNKWHKRRPIAILHHCQRRYCTDEDVVTDFSQSTQRPACFLDLHVKIPNPLLDLCTIIHVSLGEKTWVGFLSCHLWHQLLFFGLDSLLLISFKSCI
jgi:hypothetical protein